MGDECLENLAAWPRSPLGDQAGTDGSEAALPARRTSELVRDAPLYHFCTPCS